jgi:hypothetical protein
MQITLNIPWFKMIRFQILLADKLWQFWKNLVRLLLNLLLFGPKLIGKWKQESRVKLE